jgi:hypothetical protein
LLAANCEIYILDINFVAVLPPSKKVDEMGMVLGDEVLAYVSFLGFELLKTVVD